MSYWRWVGLTFYEVIRATRRSGHLQGKGPTFICQLFQDPEYSSGSRGSNPRPHTLHSRSLPTALIPPRWRCGWWLPLNETYDNLIMSWLTLQYFTASCDFPHKTYFQIYWVQQSFRKAKFVRMFTYQLLEFSCHISIEENKRSSTASIHFHRTPNKRF